MPSQGTPTRQACVSWTHSAPKAAQTKGFQSWVQVSQAKTCDLQPDPTLGSEPGQLPSTNLLNFPTSSFLQVPVGLVAFIRDANGLDGNLPSGLQAP